MNINNIKSNALVYLAYAVIALSLITLITLVLFPIYTDEIAARQYLSRLVNDYPARAGPMPLCISSFSEIFPIFWMLPAFFEWLIHGIYSNYFVLRIVGIVISIICSFILYKTISSLEIKNSYVFENNKKLFFVSIVISFLSIGVFPFFYIMNRFEQLIFLSILAILYLVNRLFYSKENIKNGFIYGCYFLLFYFLTSLILFAHAKGFYLIPFLILVYFKFYLGFKTNISKIISLLLFTSLVYTSYFAWKSYWQCPEVSAISNLINTQNIDPFLIFKSFNDFITLATKSFLDFSRYLTFLTFQNHFEAGYLPDIQVEKTLNIINSLIKIFIFVVFLLPLLLIKFYKRDFFASKFISINLLLLFLYIGFFLSSLFRLEKHWYDAGYSYILLVVICFFMFSANSAYFSKYIFNKPLLSLLFILSICSQLVLNFQFMPKFISGFSGPGVSLVRFMSSTDSRDVNTLSEKCKIDKINSTKLVIDDTTYNYFYKSKLPMPITYIWLSGDAEFSRHFIANSNSSGIIVSCSSLNTYLPELYKSYAHQEGNLCCVASKDIPSLSGFTCKDNPVECGRLK